MVLLGEIFPDFTADTQIGTIKFHEWLGDSWGILFSHPNDFTPVCTTELARVAKLMPEFKRLGVKVIALSCNSVDSHRKWIKDIKSYGEIIDEFPYPIIEDLNRKLATALGMLDPAEIDQTGLPMSARAVFIIDPAKKMRLSVLYGRPAWVKAVGCHIIFVTALRETQSCPDRSNDEHDREMMPGTSCQLETSDDFEWNTLMEVHHEPIEKNYQLLEEIGKGQFAIVRKCKEIKTSALYAAKIMRKRRVARGVAAADIAREAGLLARLRHPNIVSLYKVIDTGTTVVLLLELITGGELFHWTPSGETEAAHVVRQVLMALSHLHSHQVAHLDIKPENILLSTPPPMPSIKLIDLGLSHRLVPGSEHRALFGTPEFVAPEIVNYEPLSLGTDLWAVGVLTYILLSGASPFLGEDKQETYANVAACQYQFDNEYFNNVSEIAKDFIRSLLIKDPKERGSAESCLKHPWILTVCS